MINFAFRSTMNAYFDVLLNHFLEMRMERTICRAIARLSSEANLVKRNVAFITIAVSRAT